MIEHRHTKRVNLSTKVSIYHHGNLVADCKIKDLSLEGLALWAGPVQFHRNAMLEVEFRFQQNPKIVSVRLPAIVVHSASNVLGLMFSKMSATAHQGIRDLMQGTASQPRQSVSVRTPKEVVWESNKKAARA